MIRYMVLRSKAIFQTKKYISTSYTERGRMHFFIRNGLGSARYPMDQLSKYIAYRPYHIHMIDDDAHNRTSNM